MSRDTGGRVAGADAEPAVVVPEVPEQAADRVAEPAAEGTPEDVRSLQPLLLHSLAELREVWLPLLDAVDARSVSEVGSESGMTTSLLVETLTRRGGGRLVVVDPDPGVVPRPREELAVEVVRGYSPQALAGLAPTDVYLIDGDHNYHTVAGELATIAAAAVGAGRETFPLLVLHDVGWPAGRRDQYYDPGRLPAERVHPHSFDVGVALGDDGAGPGGFRGEGAFAWALREGGPRNGVRTAVEDFLADHDELAFHVVPSIFGLGVVVDRHAPWAAEVGRLLAPYAGNGLLARLERNRLELYLRVLQMQDDTLLLHRRRQREWARLDAERSRWAERELHLLAQVADLEHRLAEARAAADRLEVELARAEVPVPHRRRAAR